jgi:hypothetical protein
MIRPSTMVDLSFSNVKITDRGNINRRDWVTNEDTYRFVRCLIEWNISSTGEKLIRQDRTRGRVMFYLSRGSNTFLKRFRPFTE